jgi:hypothetical protein
LDEREIAVPWVTNYHEFCKQWHAPGRAAVGKIRVCEIINAKQSIPKVIRPTTAFFTNDDQK